MGKNIRYGPRFCNGSISGTRGGGLGNFIRQPVAFERKSSFPYVTKEPTREERQRMGVKGGQIRSQKIRKDKGIIPSMPSFSFDEPKPAPPPAPPAFDYLQLAERLVPGAAAVEMILEQNHHMLIAMRCDGKAFNVCLNTKTGNIMWTEGDAPKFSKRGPMKRRDAYRR